MRSGVVLHTVGTALAAVRFFTAQRKFDNRVGTDVPSVRGRALRALRVRAYPLGCTKLHIARAIRESPLRGTRITVGFAQNPTVLGAPSRRTLRVCPPLMCADFSLPPAFFFEKCHLPRQREECGRFVKRPYGLVCCFTHRRDSPRG